VNRVLPLLLLAACTGGKDTTDPAVDADDDGFSPDEGDCDDADASTFPGAPEACDGVDNDCDDEVDEGCGTGGDDVTVGYLDDLASASYAVMDAHFCLAEPITLDQDLLVHTLGFAAQPDAASDQFHVALYAEASGRPGARLANLQSVNAVDGANEYTLASPVSVPAGTVWIALCNEEPYNSGVIAGVLTPIAIYNMPDFEAGTPDPFPETGGPPTTNTLILWLHGTPTAR
jgi:Putative metal-binding motif